MEVRPLAYLVEMDTFSIKMEVSKNARLVELLAENVPLAVILVPRLVLFAIITST